MNRAAVVYAHVGLFKQDVQLAVQNQIGISKRVVVDQIIQLWPLEAVIGNFVFNGGEVNGNLASIVKNQFYAGCVDVELMDMEPYQIIQFYCGRGNPFRKIYHIQTV